MINYSLIKNLKQNSYFVNHLIRNIMVIHCLIIVDLFILIFVSLQKCELNFFRGNKE